MKRSTSIDTPFYRLMGKVGDLVALNLLWLVCSVPIVTVGASTLALFAVVEKLVAGEEYSVRQDFFRAFRRDFKQGMALALVLAAAAFAAVTGMKAAAAQDTVLTGIVAAASFLLALTAACAGCWGFALLARFCYPLSLLALSDGARMTAANLLPTVGVLALLGWMPLCWKLEPGWFVYLLLPIALIGISATALGIAVLMRPAFAQLEKSGRKEDDPEEEDGGTQA